MDLGDYWQNFFPNSEYGHTGEIVKRAFQDNYKKSIKLSGSQVTIHKIYNENANEATIEK